MTNVRIKASYGESFPLYNSAYYKSGHARHCRASTVLLLPGIKQCLFPLLSDVKFEVDLPKKLVWIESDKDVEVLMETLKKCGKEVKYNGTK